MPNVLLTLRVESPGVLLRGMGGVRMLHCSCLPSLLSAANPHTHPALNQACNSPGSCLTCAIRKLLLFFFPVPAF